MPGPPERETRKGRLSGACSRCASDEARSINPVCTGRRQAIAPPAPVKAHAGGVIPDFELVIVVPSRSDAVIEELCLHLARPPGRGLRIREIEIRRLAAPELRHMRAAFVLA